MLFGNLYTHFDISRVHRKFAFINLNVSSLTPLMPVLFILQLVLLITQKEQPFGNIEGKGENVGNQNFHLFPTCFLTFQRDI